VCKKANIENASPLPFVDYDSGSAIKVVGMNFYYLINYELAYFGSQFGL